MHGVKLVVSDDHAGLKAARHATMPGVPRQRCQFHTIQNTLAHVPKVSMKPDVAEDLRWILNADDAVEADRRGGSGCRPPGLLPRASPAVHRALPRSSVRAPT